MRLRTGLHKTAFVFFACLILQCSNTSAQTALDKNITGVPERPSTASETQENSTDHDNASHPLSSYTVPTLSHETWPEQLPITLPAVTRRLIYEDNKGKTRVLTITHPSKTMPEGELAAYVKRCKNECTRLCDNDGVCLPLCREACEE
ncbi:hypothetical protein EPN18_03745 [bacterium]|nr:MAG: hypothetical protein EPN18_03745 [bacterium]